MTTKENAKIIKTILSNLFGYKNVTTRIGTGTASGWISAKANLPKPSTCTCSYESWGTLKRCEDCRTAMEVARLKFTVERSKTNIELYTYCSDMGDEDRECFNLSFDIAGV